MGTGELLDNEAIGAHIIRGTGVACNAREMCGDLRGASIASV